MQEEAKSTSKGRALVMDDNELIRQVLGRMLKCCGYEVIPVAHGAEAIDHFKKAKEAAFPFNLVILDLHIPDGMGGKETIDALLKIDPDITAIVTSGNAEDPTMINFKANGFKHALPKPYGAGDLREALRVIVEGENENDDRENRNFLDIARTA